MNIINMSKKIFVVTSLLLCLNFSAAFFQEVADAVSAEESAVKGSGQTSDKDAEKREALHKREHALQALEKKALLEEGVETTQEIDEFRVRQDFMEGELEGEKEEAAETETIMPPVFAKEPEEPLSMTDIEEEAAAGISQDTLTGFTGPISAPPVTEFEEDLRQPIVEAEDFSVIDIEGQTEGGGFAERYGFLILGTALFLFLYFLVTSRLKKRMESEPPSEPLKGKAAEAKKENFDPRSLKKFIDKESQKDKDLFK